MRKTVSSSKILFPWQFKKMVQNFSQDLICILTTFLHLSSYLVSLYGLYDYQLRYVGISRHLGGYVSNEKCSLSSVDAFCNIQRLYLHCGLSFVWRCIGMLSGHEGRVLGLYQANKVVGSILAFTRLKQQRKILKNHRKLKICCFSCFS